MKFGTKIKSAALALALTAGMALAPLSQAEAAWHGGHGGYHGGGYHGGGYHRGYGGGALVGGLLAGGLVTAALLDRPNYYYGPPGYYPAYYPRRTVVYTNPYYAPSPYYYGY